MRDGSVTTTPMGKTRSIAAPIKMATRVTSGGGIRTPTHQGGRRSMASRRATVRSASPAAAVSVPLPRPSLAAAPRPTPATVARAYTAPRSGSRAVVALRAGIARGTPDTDSDSRVGACSHTRDTTPRATWVRCHRWTRALSVAIVGYASCAAGLTRYASLQHMAAKHIHLIFPAFLSLCPLPVPRPVCTFL